MSLLPDTGMLDRPNLLINTVQEAKLEITHQARINFVIFKEITERYRFQAWMIHNMKIYSLLLPLSFLFEPARIYTSFCNCCGVKTKRAFLFWVTAISRKRIFRSTNSSGNFPFWTYKKSHKNGNVCGKSEIHAKFCFELKTARVGKFDDSTTKHFLQRPQSWHTTQTFAFSRNTACASRTRYKAKKKEKS